MLENGIPDGWYHGYRKISQNLEAMEMVAKGFISFSNFAYVSIELFSFKRLTSDMAATKFSWDTILDVSQWWRHQVETISVLLALCAGNSPVTGEFPSQMAVTRSFDFSLIFALTNSWVNNRDAGD